ncbi:MAG TPA: PilZ domain-containing protein [Solirubrobacteraceae bacterium]|nr:PilZ domain-containing protein [Solirubrobacteraceae bacterium]
MPGKKAKSGKPDEGSEQTTAVAQSPSVAAHPRAALAVARAKAWGGLFGFFAGGYLSLATSTLLAAGLRALAAGLVCYLAAWAGAVFVWRHLVMLEYASVSVRTQQRSLELASGQGTSLPYRRENVRVQTERPLVAYIGADRSPVQTFTIDLSAGGMLVGGLGRLTPGELFEFELTLAGDDAPVKGAATVVRTDSQGRCAVTFRSIGTSDERRLVKFIFERLRDERQEVA